MIFESSLIPERLSHKTFMQEEWNSSEEKEKVQECLVA